MLVDYPADPGDSGAPTFVWYPNNSVDIAGIHVGEVTHNTTGQRWRFFSKFSEIACDLAYCDMKVW